MRRVVLPALVLGTAALTGCQHGPVSAPPSSAPTPASPAAPAQAPPDPEPAADGPCPYLDSGFVAQANGQHVSKVRTSKPEQGQRPACFFYALNGKLQLTVRVYTGTEAVAKALVDKAAPVGTSSPATDPPGWQGGYQPMDGGAVYAVGKQGTAVVVTTNQAQTVKARTVAKQAISALAL
jgi:hypothetical protein